MEADRIMNVRECAAYLQLSEGTIRRYVKEGWIPYFKVGSAIRFKESSVYHYLTEVR